MRGKRQSNHQRRREASSITGYEIEVLGHLDEKTFEWFGSMSIDNQENGSALLGGAIPDQPALIRILLQLNDLGITLLSVKALRRRRNR